MTHTGVFIDLICIMFEVLTHLQCCFYHKEWKHLSPGRHVSRRILQDHPLATSEYTMLMCVTMYIMTQLWKYIGYWNSCIGKSSIRYFFTLLLPHQPDILPTGLSTIPKTEQSDLGQTLSVLLMDMTGWKWLCCFWLSWFLSRHKSRNQWDKLQVILFVSSFRV